MVEIGDERAKREEKGEGREGERGRAEEREYWRGQIPFFRAFSTAALLWARDLSIISRTRTGSVATLRR